MTRSNIPMNFLSINSVLKSILIAFMQWMNVFCSFLLSDGLWSKGEDLGGGKAHLWKSRGHLLWDQLHLWQRPGGPDKDGEC